MLSLCRMRRIVSRVLSRVLLSPPFTVAMETEAQPHEHAPHEHVRRKLVVGLGNPGLDGTRHNVGRAVLERLAGRLGAAGRWRGDRRLNADLVLVQVQGLRVVLLKPRVAMNLHGVCVARAVRTFGVDLEDVLLVHDDLDKALGKVSVKLGGSARGHNGVRSCVDALGSDVMVRLRVGIGRPAGNTSVEKHVLGRFSPNENKVLEPVLDQSLELLLSLISPEGGATTTGRPQGGATTTGRPQRPPKGPQGGATNKERPERPQRPLGGATERPEEPQRSTTNTEEPQGGATEGPQEEGESRQL